jgi:hypothetical protein
MKGRPMSYPLLNVFWTIFEVFLWVTWFWILITVFIDIFRSRDLSGGAKAVWFLFVLLIPLVGVVVYLVVRGAGMHERTAQVVQARDAAYDGYLAQNGTSSSTADQLAKLADLHDRNVISDQEFAQEKAKVMAA